MTVPEIDEKFDEKAHATHIESAAGHDEWSHIRSDAIIAEDKERAMGVIEGLKTYPAAVFWSFCISCCISESFLALPLLRTDSPQLWRATTQQCSVMSLVSPSSARSLEPLSTRRTDTSCRLLGRPRSAKHPTLGVSCE